MRHRCDFENSLRIDGFPFAHDTRWRRGRSYTVRQLPCPLEIEFDLRRHDGRLRLCVFIASARAVGAVALISVVGIGLAQRLLAAGSDRSWLWMAGATGLLAAGSVLLTLLPGRGLRNGRGPRWRPGDRIPPQPLGELDLDRQ